MGLTKQSTGIKALDEMFHVEVDSPDDIVVALAGNPNTGKSTVFNNFTGMNQHTGNWPGKTVTNAQGKYMYKDKKYILVDLPGTYSLLSNSAEEQVARDFICFGGPHVTVVVTDATCLERNLNLVLQIMEMTKKVVVCVNLLDEAEKKTINVNLNKLSKLLGVPVIGTSARSGKGLNELKEAIEKVAKGDIINKSTQISYDIEIEEAIKEVEEKLHPLVGEQINSRWAALRLIDIDDKLMESLNDYLGLNLLEDLELQEVLKKSREQLNSKNISLKEFQDKVVSSIVSTAEGISREVVSVKNKIHNQRDRNIDRILTSRKFGIPIMVALLGVVFWLTITGANYPSSMLATFFGKLEIKVSEFLIWIGIADWLYDILVLGIYRTLAWVISVMLPPMAIFFPIFTLLEDLGYLPRVAFNLDYYFKKACAHGKQALTMCMEKLML